VIPNRRNLTRKQGSMPLAHTGSTVATPSSPTFRSHPAPPHISVISDVPPHMNAFPRIAFDQISGHRSFLSSEVVARRSLAGNRAVSDVGHGWLDEPMTLELNRQDYLVQQHRALCHATHRRVVAE